MISHVWLNDCALEISDEIHLLMNVLMDDIV